MKRILFFVIALIVVIPLFSNEVMVFTANQYFLSRIYTLTPSGSVLDYLEYENYHFCDLAVVDNQLYAAEAFAPRVLKVDLETGDLEVIVNDWSLFYFYDIAFDGTFFYVTEWDLNRYDINGVKDGTASFDEDVFGSAWDGQYLYMLNGNNQIKCWDVSLWPNLIEITTNNFIPPSDACRGLWFDGNYFWSAESIEDNLGYIYQFDYSGQIIDQIPAPAWIGFGVCKINQGFAVADEPSQSIEQLTASPNPCFDHCCISFSLVKYSKVTCTLYDIKGRMIETIFSENYTSGIHTFIMDTYTLPSGMYFLKLQTEQSIDMVKILRLDT